MATRVVTCALPLLIVAMGASVPASFSCRVLWKEQSRCAFSASTAGTLRPPVDWRVAGAFSAPLSVGSIGAPAAADPRSTPPANTARFGLHHGGNGCPSSALSARRFRRSSDGAASTATTTPMGERKSERCVCVILPRNGGGDFVLPNVGSDTRSEPASSFDARSVARDVAADLSLPLMELPDGDGDGDDADGWGGEWRETTARMFSHCLCLVPYERGRIRSYALAIQTLGDATGWGRKKGSGGKRTSRKRRRGGGLDKRDALMKPFLVDLAPLPGSDLYTRLVGGGGGGKGGGGSELLLKAVAPAKCGGGSGGGEGAVVYDLTAGFGRDSAVIASAPGTSSVCMVERDPVVAVLLSDALRRLRLVAADAGAVLRGGDSGDGCNEAEGLAVNLASKMTLHIGEGIDVARAAAASVSPARDDDGGSVDEAMFLSPPDVCYLDPMFPPRTKSAAVKKNMQILHDLLESSRRAVDADGVNDRQKKASERYLLESAIAAARCRVVVKRPAQAPPLGGEDGVPLSSSWRPSYSVRGSVSRWDVYIKQG